MGKKYVNLEVFVDVVERHAKSCKRELRTPLRRTDVSAIMRDVHIVHTHYDESGKNIAMRINSPNMERFLVSTELMGSVWC